MSFVKSADFAKKVKATIKNIDPAAEVFLFGSRARKDHDKYSDWDFFVITDIHPIRAFEDKLIDVLYPLMLEYDALIQVVAFSKTDWKNGASPSPLYDNIRTEALAI